MPSTAAATSGSMGLSAPGVVFLESLVCEMWKRAISGSSERCSAAFAIPQPFASNSNRASSYVSSKGGKGLMVFLGGESDERGSRGAPPDGRTLPHIEADGSGFRARPATGGERWCGTYRPRFEGLIGSAQVAPPWGLSPSLARSGGMESDPGEESK